MIMTAKKSIYIKLKSRLSVCLSTFQSGHSAISRTTLCIEAVFAPHEVLIIQLCQEYQETLQTAIVSCLRRQEYKGVDETSWKYLLKTHCKHLSHSTYTCLYTQV